MSFPSAKTALHRVAADPHAPAKLRIEALSKLDSPQRGLLVRIMRDSHAPSKLKALAALKYSDMMDARAKTKVKRAVPDQASTNALGLKP